MHSVHILQQCGAKATIPCDIADILLSDDERLLIAAYAKLFVLS